MKHLSYDPILRSPHCNRPLVPVALGDIRCALERGHSDECQPRMTDLPLLHEIVEKARVTNPEWFS